MAANFTPKGEGFAGEGWNIKPEVMSAFSIRFGEVLFEAIVRSS